MGAGAAAAPALAGVGLKDEHLAQVLADGAAIDFFEVHAENFMVAGGPRLRALEQVRDRWPLSIHGVGLSIGGADPLDEAHLDRLAALVHRFEPRWVSEHLAWSGHGGTWFNDLLPVPCDATSLARVCEHVDRVQTRLRRRLLIENPSRYLEFESSTMSDGEFLAELVRRTGCALLLDVNNAFVSGVNLRRDPWALIATLPASAVHEIHLAGHAADRADPGDTLLIDDHGSPVAEAVWALYERTLERLGPVPTLIERDHDIPPLAALEREAARARSTLVRAGEGARSGPVAGAAAARASRREAVA